MATGNKQLATKKKGGKARKVQKRFDAVICTVRSEVGERSHNLLLMCHWRFVMSGCVQSCG